MEKGWRAFCCCCCSFLLSSLLLQPQHHPLPSYYPSHSQQRQQHLDWLRERCKCNLVVSLSWALCLTGSLDVAVCESPNLNKALASLLAAAHRCPTTEFSSKCLRQYWGYRRCVLRYNRLRNGTQYCRSNTWPIIRTKRKREKEREKSGKQGKATERKPWNEKWKEKRNGKAQQSVQQQQTAMQNMKIEQRRRNEN